MKPIKVNMRCSKTDRRFHSLVLQDHKSNPRVNLEHPKVISFLKDEKITSKDLTLIRFTMHKIIGGDIASECEETFLLNLSNAEKYTGLLGQYLSRFPVPKVCQRHLIEGIFRKLEDTVRDPMCRIVVVMVDSLLSRSQPPVKNIHIVDLTSLEEIIHRQLCVICSKELAEVEIFRGRKYIARTPCLHHYHIRCIDRSLEISDLCPSCQHVIPNVGEKAQTTQSCAICFREITEFQSFALPCKHRYHHMCIAPWLNKSPTCPLCRRPVKEQVHCELEVGGDQPSTYNIWPCPMCRDPMHIPEVEEEEEATPSVEEKEEEATPSVVEKEDEAMPNVKEN